MPTRNELYDLEADAVHDHHEAERDRLAVVIPGFSSGGHGSFSCGPSPSLSRAGEQASKGIARRVRRYLAEPAFIAGCGVAGALFEVQHGGLRGDAPVIGMAAFAAGFATVVGMARFLVRAHRTGTHAFGGFAIRAAAMLLCVGFEFYGLSCWCDDVSPVIAAERLISFE